MRISTSIARIDLPYPRFNPEDHFLPAHVLTRCHQHYEGFISRHSIKVRRWRSGVGGKADMSRKMIWVPVIKHLGDFWVAMHEIGHILSELPATWRPPPCELIVHEYEADMFALSQCQALGLSTEYEHGARRNVFKYVQRTHRQGIAWADLPQFVRTTICQDWLGIQEQQWQATRIELLER